MLFLTYRNAGLTSSIVNRLGPPAAKPFGKEQPLPPVGKKKNIFSRLGKDVNSVSIKIWLYIYIFSYRSINADFFKFLKQRVKFWNNFRNRYQVQNLKLQ